MMQFLFKKMNTYIYIRWRTFLVFRVFHICSVLRFSSFHYLQLINKMWLSLSELSGRRHPHQLSIVVCLGDIGGGPRCLFWGPSFLVMRQRSWWQELRFSSDPLFVLNSFESTLRRRNKEKSSHAFRQFSRFLPSCTQGLWGIQDQHQVVLAFSMNVSIFLSGPNNTFAPCLPCSSNFITDIKHAPLSPDAFLILSKMRNATWVQDFHACFSQDWTQKIVATALDCVFTFFL